jgi:hypothetical protein
MPHGRGSQESGGSWNREPGTRNRNPEPGTRNREEAEDEDEDENENEDQDDCCRPPPCQLLLGI